MLYLVATPIGNLSDITLRALQVLKECDAILCEDTRHSIHLLNRYEIKKPLISFHSFNEIKKQNEIVDMLKSGKTLALISDAGTPLISDPGESLVKRLREEGIKVSPLPGPSSLIAALCASGLPTTFFQFLGFMPRGATERDCLLAKTAFFEGTSIFFESAERIVDVLETIAKIGPDWQIVIARELTKTYEEFLQGNPKELLDLLEKKRVKGELVLMLNTGQDPLQKQIHDLSAKELCDHLTTHFKLPLKEAIKIAASFKGLPKQKLYQEFHNS